MHEEGGQTAEGGGHGVAATEPLHAVDAHPEGEMQHLEVSRSRVRLGGRGLKGKGKVEI